MKREFDVLVTDSRYKHSLSIVRSLGKAGLKVATCSEGFSPTRFSRYSKKSFTYARENFGDKLKLFLNKNKVKLVLPVGYFTNIECSKIKKEIEKYSNVVLPEFNQIEKVSNKGMITEILNSAKMPYPKTNIVEKMSDLKKIRGRSFVIKSSQEEKGKKVEYATSVKELKETLKPRLDLGPQIVQEYVVGEGRGYFAFCNNGVILQSFQHKRIRQYPETGGVSSCAESINDENLKKLSESFLKKIKWTGPVMLEYIYDKKNKKYYFIEMNAKFWGSYDLSVACRLNFAKIPLDLVLKKKMRESKYKVGQKFQWVLPEDTIRIKTAKDRTQAKIEWKKDLFNSKVKKDIQYIFNDPVPTIIRMLSTIWRYLFRK